MSELRKGLPARFITYTGYLYHIVCFAWIFKIPLLFATRLCYYPLPLAEALVTALPVVASVTLRVNTC